MEGGDVPQVATLADTVPEPQGQNIKGNQEKDWVLGRTAAAEVACLDFDFVYYQCLLNADNLVVSPNEVTNRRTKDVQTFTA